jgi:hypothetical protein
MDSPKPTPTVDRSLDALSLAVGKAADDLRAVRVEIDRARADMRSRNTTILREVVSAAERVIAHLARVDEDLKIVLKDLGERD